MFSNCVRIMKRYETFLQIFVIFIWLCLLKLGIFTNSSLLLRDTSEREEKLHKYSLTSRLKTDNETPTDSVADEFTNPQPIAMHTECFERFRKLSPEKDGVNTLGRLPLLDLEAVKLICSTITKDSSVLEWGCGGSTAFFARYVASWDCIDHIPDWAKFVQKQLNNQTFRDKVRVNTVEPNNRDFDNSWPAILFHDGDYWEFRDYVEFPRSLNKQFDVIIDDGRARVSAALSAIRNRLFKEDGVLIIHDWEREPYKILLKKGYQLLRSDTESWRHLAILKPVL